MVRFSILLPTHNRADVIGYSIQSILNQSFCDFELLIVGDGCTDSTSIVVQRFMRQDPRIQWFPFAKGRGFGYEHRNTVLKKAKGELIAFAAHDDIWFPEHLASFHNFFSKQSTFRIAYSRPVWVHPNGSVIPSFFDISNHHVQYSFWNLYNGIPATCIVHTRKALKYAGYWNSHLPHAADWDLWRRVATLDPQRKIGFIGRPTTAHFRAIWRNSNSSHDETISEVYRTHMGLTLQLLVLPKSKKSQQESFLSVIQNKSWHERLNKTLLVLQDKTLTDSLALLEQNRVLVSLNNEYKNALHRITNTKGYRFMEFLRKLITAPSFLRR